MSVCSKLSLALVISIALLAGSLRAEFVYVVNTGANNVSAYRIAENGALTPVTGSPFPTGIDPFSVAAGRFVYVANAGSNNVSAYRITENGALTPVAGSPFPTGNDPSLRWTSLAGSST